MTDDSVIDGNTLSTTIYVNEERALSEYISYYDDPNDDDNNLPTSVKVRTTGATGLGIEVDGVVTNLDSAIEQSFAIESLDDIFVVGNASVSNEAESIEIAVNDGFLWSEWTTLDMTTANPPPVIAPASGNIAPQVSVAANFNIDVKVEAGEFVLYESGTDTIFKEDFLIGADYRFNLADPSNLGHTFWFSETEDGVHNGGENFGNQFMTNSPIGFLGDPGIEEFFGIYGSYSQIKIPTITNIPRRIDVKVENNTFQLYEYGTNNPFTDDLIQGISYEFHLADSSNLGHTFWFSETEDGIHNGGTNFTETAGTLWLPRSWFIRHSRNNDVFRPILPGNAMGNTTFHIL